jgi:predicted ribosome quality control (RQC) complex YloA/Tae2 family protein
MGVEGEDQENVEEGSGHLVEELWLVHEKLRELGEFQPLLQEEIDGVQKQINDLLERIEQYDMQAEKQYGADQLSRHEDAMVVAKAMESLVAVLQDFAEKKDMLLDTKMVLETTINDLHDESRELLRRFPEGTPH